MFKIRWEKTPLVTIDLPCREQELVGKVASTVGAERVLVKEAHGGKTILPWGVPPKEPVTIERVVKYLFDVAYDQVPTTLEIVRGVAFPGRKFFGLGIRSGEEPVGWIKVSLAE